MCSRRLWQLTRLSLLAFLVWRGLQMSAARAELKAGKDFTGVGVGAFIFDEKGRVPWMKRHFRGAKAFRDVD